MVETLRAVEVVGLTGIVATGLLVVASIQWLAVNQFVAINGAVFGFLTLRNSCLSYPRSLTSQPREASGKIVCSNCHLRTLPTSYLAPQSIQAGNRGPMHNSKVMEL